MVQRRMRVGGLFFLGCAVFLSGYSAVAGSSGLLKMARQVVVEDLRDLLTTIADHAESRSTVCLELGKYLRNVTNLLGQSEDYYAALVREDIADAELKSSLPDLVRGLSNMAELTESFCFTQSRFHVLERNSRYPEGYYVSPGRLDDLRKRLVKLTQLQYLIALVLMPESADEILAGLRSSLSAEERDLVAAPIRRSELVSWYPD